MNLIGNNPMNCLADCYSNSNPFFSAQNVAKSHKEDSISYSTIDGEEVNFTEGALAINSGAGIFIGGYFVGKSECYEQMQNIPFVRY